MPFGVTISVHAFSGTGVSPAVRGKSTVLAVSSSALVAIWKMKATRRIVIMSIIGMMLR